MTPGRGEFAEQRQPNQFIGAIQSIILVDQKIDCGSHKMAHCFFIAPIEFTAIGLELSHRPASVRKSSNWTAEDWSLSDKAAKRWAHVSQDKGVIDNASLDALLIEATIQP
jgi:hypothetical protein